MVSCESAGEPVQPTWRSGYCCTVSVVQRKETSQPSRDWRLNSGMTHVGEDLDRLLEGAEAVGLEGSHVEDVNALGLADELEALDTGGLLAAEC